VHVFEENKDGPLTCETRELIYERCEGACAALLRGQIED
jgi:hypothetical protein